MQPPINCPMPKKIRDYIQLFFCFLEESEDKLFCLRVWTFHDGTLDWHEGHFYLIIPFSYIFFVCFKNFLGFQLLLYVRNLKITFQKRKLGVISNIFLYICIVLKSMLLVEVFNFKCKLLLQNK